ncbi:MAG: GldM family protein [Bacteroidia bacterium]|nr:GldM family protein [Bacteroidia bacterium]
MINMMYLVLLALLAMNVSAEILNAFQIIKGKLNTSANTALLNSKSFMDGMKTKIDEEVKNQGKTSNVGLKDTLDQIKSKTAEIVGLLDTHINYLTNDVSGVDPETGKLMRADELEKNYQYWMGNGAEEDMNDKRGNGKAFELHQKLDEYVNYIIAVHNKNVKDPSQQLKFDQENLTDDPDPATTIDHQVKTWERYIFEGPLTANLAILESMKLDVYEKEKKLLDLLNTRVGAATFKVDQVVPVDAPFATIVPAGLQFQTRLLVTMTSAQIKPTYSSGSGRVETQPDGTAILTVGASGGVIPSDKPEGKQSYSATIQVPKATGGFETLNVQGQFTVRRPEIVVTSAAVQVLYRNCANDVNIDVPALGDNYNPQITASSGEVITNQQSKKKVRLVPTGKTCKVTVNSITNGQTLKIGDLDYKVIEPPKPSINMAINGKTYNGSQMVPKSSRIQLRLEPDEDFAANLPADARYSIGGVQVLAQLSLGPPTPINSINTGGQDATKPINVALGQGIRDARPGTKVYVKISDIARLNFKNQRVVDGRFTEVERTLSLVVE